MTSATPDFLPSLDGNALTTLCLLGAMALLLFLTARRVAWIRGMMTLAGCFLVAGALLITIRQQERFNPYVADFLRQVNLGGQEVRGETVRIAMSPDGHFWARVSINGQERRMLIDSGATVTALSADTAAELGVKIDQMQMPVVMRTANGTVRAESGTVDTLQLGGIFAEQFPVLVAPGLGNTSVLGMNFLSRLKSWRVEGRVLILEPHALSER